ncbi:GldG family protein [Acetivibrio cellulolyticus]|uniref:GldG family protein n=1 Tax=Acetivibrio cellulolyticus TaxID=35830 RepID=UPI0001E2FAF9|nr:GldG family protein [Acetivibrio cellulolyticus]
MSILKNKNFKYGSIFTILSLVVIGIMVAVNLLAEIDKFDVEWDLTPNKMYSIGEQTDKILNELKQDVKITFLADKQELMEIEGAGEMITEFLDKYEEYPKVTVEYVDPDKHPEIISKLDKDNLLGLQVDNIVVSSGSKSKKVVAQELFTSDQQTGTPFFTAEQSITGAVKYVTNEKTPVIYFLEGHGERALDSEYTGMKQILENGNYSVKTINLAVVEKVPEDAEIVVIAGPKSDLSSAEADRLTNYFKKNGNAIFMFDPTSGDKKFNNFEAILNEYNIGLNYDRVKENDDQRHYPNDPYTFLPFVEANEITGEDTSEFYMVLNSSRSINLLSNEKEPLTVYPLLKTSDKATGESYGVTNGETTMGPLYVGAAAEYNSAYKSKIVVYGNAYSLTDEVLNNPSEGSQNTMQLFLASFSWMRNTANDLVITPKTTVYDTVNLTSNSAKMVILVTVLVVPLLIIIIGVFVWLRRRRL